MSEHTSLPSEETIIETVPDATIDTVEVAAESVVPATAAQLVEALLFAHHVPVSIRKLAKLTELSEEIVQSTVTALQAEYRDRSGGIVIVLQDGNVQMTTAPETAEQVAAFLKTEQTGELTRPALETLTIIAYRGPVSKSEIELIRGVNCSLILRNLMIRGLVEEAGETETGSPIYQVTIDFLKFLGITDIAQLPDYQELNENVHLKELLEKQSQDFFTDK
jgi:segregation and condensation protein B